MNTRSTENKNLNDNGHLSVLGARVHNLKNIDVDIPHNALTVITGLSGSGKSSLAFDTIFAEGQRRYIETFSAYARNMLGNLERPDVDKITGLSPVIAIEQKTINRNPRSTIGTTTEVYDFLRLLYARVGMAVSYVTGEPMVKYTRDQIVELILERYDGHKVYILAPLVKNRKGHYKELFEQLRKKGFLTVRVDGELRDLTLNMMVDRYKNHDIELVIDRLKVSRKDLTRLESTVGDALRQGDKQVMVYDVDNDKVAYFSQTLMDAASGISYREPAPHNFSFNSPLGACPCCKGLGYVNIVDREKIIPNSALSIYEGAILPLGKHRNSMIFWQIDAICKKYGCTLKTPVRELPEEAIGEILNGTSERLVIENDTMATYNYFQSYDGLLKYIEMQQGEEASAAAKKWSEGFFSRAVCPECNGDRLNREALHFFVDGKNIAQLCRLDISELYEWSKGLEDRLSPSQAMIAREIMKEIRGRLKFLVDVGLDYLQLNRASATLSGGESQRIRLATQLGSQLVNVLYILDEPSIGLHQRDNDKLIATLKNLRDLGNTLIVVEHDEDTMRAADWIVDIGPAAGVHGGNVVYSGDVKGILKCKGSVTGQYLSGKLKIPVPKKRRKPDDRWLKVIGAEENNLKKINVDIPIGVFTCVTGVSGSGKSSLVNEIIYKHLFGKLNKGRVRAGKFKDMKGLENLDKVIMIDQSPIGRTPRSNPATYTGVFTEIRELFAQTSDAKTRGYKAGRFSFNVKGGRCEACEGDGILKIEMHFLPDIFVPCEVCKGHRYNRETLEVRYKGKNIYDVLEMTVSEGVEFFENIPRIFNKLKTLEEVGLGYIKIGQSSTTLSGGEAQRIKLAAELSKRSTGKTIYILDEPTTGLHSADVQKLINILQRLTDAGNTVLVIEHNLDVIKTADYIIDMGPEGGDNGGTVIAKGTPEQIAENKRSYTGQYLLKMLNG